MHLNQTLHPLMPDTLALAPMEQGVVLLVRHSLRQSIPQGSHGLDIPLTPAGVQLAEEWGKNLNISIGRIFSSPVGRCVQTGEAIARGINLPLDVKIKKWLGEPGAYVFDTHLASPYFFEHGPIEIVSRQLNGDCIPGMHSIEEGTRKILSGLFQNHPASGTLDIYISHDSILGCVIYHLLGYRGITEETWPWMLEGAFFWKTNAGIGWAWRGATGEIVFQW